MKQQVTAFRRQLCSDMLLLVWFAFQSLSSMADGDVSVSLQFHPISGACFKFPFL